MHRYSFEHFCIPKTMRLYLDTSIWLDHFENREKNGKHATRLLEMVIKKKVVVCYSDIVIRELRCNGYTVRDILILWKSLKPEHLRRVHIHKEEIQQAKNLALQQNVPLGDAFHAILARNNDAILISRDKDFEKLKDIIHTKRPEDYLSIPNSFNIS